MGNRATVVFTAGDHISPAVYLHWQGGPESVYAFLDELDRREVRADADYECARFIGIVAEFFDADSYGTTSLGVTNGPTVIAPEALAEVQTDHGDNGFYVVNRADRSGITAYPQGLDVALANGEVTPPAPRRLVRRFTESWPIASSDLATTTWEPGFLREWDRIEVRREHDLALTQQGMPGYEAIRAFYRNNGKPTEAEEMAKRMAEYEAARQRQTMTLIEGGGEA